MRTAIRFNDVCRHFGSKQVLNELSFQVEPGQVYAFLGRNGVGKTTALRILLGFLEPHGGTSEILGIDSQNLQPEHRARIGYVGEGHKLYTTMRVKSAVALEAGTRPDFRRDYAQRAMDRCAIDGKQFIRSLSRGQRAQLSLVLAVASQPEVLVFDDPAMGLDVVMRRELLDVMIDLMSETDVAVLFSSHILTEVERIADRVGILHDGAMIVDATVDDLKRRVQRRLWVPSKGATLPNSGAVISSQRRSGGQDLTLVEPDAALLGQLASRGNLSEPMTPSLEELFIDLTAGNRWDSLAEVARS